MECKSGLSAGRLGGLGSGMGSEVGVKSGMCVVGCGCRKVRRATFTVYYPLAGGII